MYLNRKFFTLFLFILFSAGLKAQETLNWNALAPDNNMLVGNEVYLRDGKKNTIDGTPLLLEDWTLGKLVFRNKVMDSLYLNMLNDEGQLYVLKVEEDSTIYNVDETVIKEVVIYGEESKRVFLYYSPVLVEYRSGKSKFYEVIYQNQITLLKVGQKSFMQAEQEKAFSMKEEKSKYVLNETYFFKVGEEEKYNEIRLSKKSFLKNLRGQLEQRAKEILSKNKLRLNKEADAVKFLKMLEEGILDEKK